MIERRATQKDVDEKASVQKLAMTESDFQTVNPKGHKREYREDGGYSWTNSYTPNDGHGKLTPIAQAVTGGMKKFADADTERARKLQENIERTAMSDGNGGTHFVEPGQADDCARRNGWGHRWRAGGLVLKAGPEGMLFRLFRDAWEPTGKITAGVMGKPCPRRGVQHDPDGRPWVFRAGEWDLE